jgi:MFS family permease
MATAQTAPSVFSKGLKKACLPVCSALALLFLLVSFRTFVHVYDEGFALVNGERVLKGEIPYRDYWTVYPPGQSYALAAVFRLFGPTLGAARLYDTLVRFALVVGVLLIGRRIAPAPAAVAAAVLATLWLATALFYAYAVFPALALASFALLAWMEYAATGRQRWLAASGALTGAAALFRADVGVYAGAAIVLAWVFAVLSSPPSPSAGPRAPLRAAGVFLGCAAAVAVPFYLYLFLAAGVERVWEVLVVFPLTTFRRVRHLPYPPLAPDFRLFFQRSDEYVRWAHFYLPPVIFGVSALCIGVSLFSRAEDEPAARKRTGGALVIAFGGLVFAQALSRYDWIHVLPASIWAALALAFLFGRLPWADRRRRPLTVGAAAAALTALAASFLGAHLRPAVQALSDTLRYASPFSCHSEVDRASCAVLGTYQAQAIQLVRNVTAPDEPIFVGNHRHDLILFNDAAFYFLAGRPCPTAYHELHPGVATTLGVQQTIARDIERQGVKWIVLAEWPAPSEPNDSAVSSGVRYLDRWIRARYRPVAAFGNYSVWRAG